MATPVDPKVEPFHELSFILGSFVFCNDCKREAMFESAHPMHTDKFYYDQAVTMERQGWVILPGEFNVACPACAARRASGGLAGA